MKQGVQVLAKILFVREVRENALMMIDTALFVLTLVLEVDPSLVFFVRFSTTLLHIDVGYVERRAFFPSFRNRR